MNKMKLAICMKDLEYQARFVNCFMNHYKHQYEVHVFTNLDELKLTEPLEYAVIITGEYTTEEMANFVERGEILLVLTESGIENKKKEHFENFNFIEKYQEVYKIAEILQRLTAESQVTPTIGRKAAKSEWIGVYSLTREAFQIPFVALLAKLYGEEKKVLVLDLQNYSGLTESDVNIPHMGLEDLLSIATIGSYSRGRILDCIGHETDWDYVYPVKNTHCLIEGTLEHYGFTLDILEKELGYERIIINFGATYQGQLEMMERCHRFYLLCGKEEWGTWREKEFLQELESFEKRDLLRKIEKIEIPTVSTPERVWRAIVDKWYWSSFGEKIRQIIGKENVDGAAV